SSTMLTLGTGLPEFRLPTGDGVEVSCADFSDQPLLVIFMCNHCPFVLHLRSALAAFGQQYQEQGLSIVGISSNDVIAYPQDGPEKMVEEARDAGYTFSYLYDSTQEVAKAFQAACTPDFFVFDRGHRLVYRGQFDSSRPENGVPVTGEDLRAACDAVLTGDPVAEMQVPSIGCNIKWRAGNEPAYFDGQPAA
ncbi:MAG: thioredoxin family protein, partial [Planctomycetaceae bacterium]